MRHRTVTGKTANAHLCHIAHPHRLRTTIGDHHRRQILQAADSPLGPHQQRFLALRQASGTIVAVIALDSHAQLLQADATRRQRCGIRHHLEAAHHATKRIDIGHPGQGAQRRTYHPVQHTTLLLQRGLALDGEHQHLAQRRGDRCHTASHARRQIAQHIHQPLRHLLARPVDIDAIAKIQCDIGNGVFGYRAQHALPGDTQHFLFDRRHYARLDLLRRHAGCLHDDLDLGRGHIRKGIDRQVQQTDSAGPRRQQGEHAHQQPLRQGKFDQSCQGPALHHSPPMPVSAALMAATPRTTTWSSARNAPLSCTSLAPSRNRFTLTARKPVLLRT